jgi:L-alanine-DL-glutamate epimerase-like enolase superfamily enzyme
MRIEQIKVRRFTYVTNTMHDTDGHGHPGPERSTTGACLTITCDDATAGHVIARLPDVREDLLDQFVRPVLVGADPLRIVQLWQALYKWQRGSGGRLTDRMLASVELTHWDLFGKVLGQPVWKLVGGYRDRILAYGAPCAATIWKAA